LYILAPRRADTDPNFPHDCGNFPSEKKAE
jgi:hypothetical protein